MSLLLVAPDQNRADILHSYTGNVAYNLVRYISANSTQQIHSCSRTMEFVLQKSTSSTPEQVLEKILNYQAVLFFGLKVMDRPVANVRRLCTLLAGIPKNRRPIIFQMSDSAVGDKSNADYTFCTRTSRFKCDRDVIVGWGANAADFHPTQWGTTTRILLDHPDYTDNFYSRDISNAFITELSSYLKKSFRTDVVCRKFVSGGICDSLDTPAVRFDRRGVPYSEYVEALNNSDIFVVTHPESVGLSALEAGMAGCKILVPEKYIPDELIDCIPHTKLTGANYDFQYLLTPTDKNITSSMSKRYSFDRIGRIVLNFIEEQIRNEKC